MLFIANKDVGYVSNNQIVSAQQPHYGNIVWLYPMFCI